MNTKISLVYGEKVFDVEVRELSQAQKNNIAAKINIEREKVVSYRNIKTEFTNLVDTQETNRAILDLDEGLSIIEKVKLLWEQKRLLGEIKVMRPNVEAKAIAPVSFEEIAKEHFEMLISGEGKASLMKEIDEAKDSYQTILDTVLETVKKEKEKKSSSS